MAEPPAHAVHGWLLSGGQGLRMGGIDKGLCLWRGQPLALHVAQRLAPQVGALCINANRHPGIYTPWGWPTLPDDADLPAHAGPLVGILTGLRHGCSPWVQLAPCDTPALPSDLVERLHQAALHSGAQIAVPVTTDHPAPGQPTTDAAQRPHWTSALVARELAPALEGALLAGERKVGRWMTQQRWIGVCFDESAEFININTPETLHGHP